nr:odorant receptor 27 [Pachyrhinus yasumatsui]
MTYESYNLNLTLLLKTIMFLSGVDSANLKNSKMFQRCLKSYSIILLGLIYVITIFQFIVSFPKILKDGNMQVMALSMSNGLSLAKTSFKATVCLNPKMTKLILKCFSEHQESYNIKHDKEIKKEFKRNSDFFYSFFTMTSVIVVVEAVCLTLSLIICYFQNLNFSILSDIFPFPDYPGLGLCYKLITIYVSGIYNLLVFLYSLTPTVYISVQLKTIQILTKNLKVDGDASRDLKNIILWHQNIIRFVGELNDMMSLPLLVEYIVVAVILGALMVVDLMPDTTLYYQIISIGFFCIHTIQLFLMSWQANEINIESTAISDSLAESNWYKQDKEVQQIIHFMMLRTQRPLTINVGRFFPMTLHSAVVTIKLAYSYATMALAIQ